MQFEKTKCQHGKTISLLLILFLCFFVFDQKISAQTEGDGVEQLNKNMEEFKAGQEEVLKVGAQIANEKPQSDELEADPTEDPAFKKEKKVKPKVAPVIAPKLKFSETLSMTLGPIQKMTEKELMSLLKSMSKGSAVESYVEEYPKLASYAVAVLKDKNAIPSAAKILDEEDRMINFSGFMLATLVLGFLIKRFLKKDGRSIGMAIFLWFVRLTIVNCLRLGLIIYFYSTELTPLFDVTMKFL